MSENERQSQTNNAVIDDKLQGTVVAYLMCGGIVSNQIKESYGEKVNCVVHFLQLSSVLVRRKKCMRQLPSYL